jgi:hypothetical protein
LTAVPTSASPVAPVRLIPGTSAFTAGPPPSSAPLSSNPSSVQQQVVYLLSADGQGVGDDLDTIVFVNTEAKDKKHSMKYGDVVGLKSLAGKERSVPVHV